MDDRAGQVNTLRYLQGINQTAAETGHTRDSYCNHSYKWLWQELVQLSLHNSSTVSLHLRKSTEDLAQLMSSVSQLYMHITLHPSEGRFQRHLNITVTQSSHPASGSWMKAGLGACLMASLGLHQLTSLCRVPCPSLRSYTKQGAPEILANE